MTNLNRLRAIVCALLLAVCLALPAVSHAQLTPVISAYVGTQTATSKVGYFVLDFNDAGPTPETYAFGYYYEGTPTDGNLLVLLQNSLTGPNGFQQAGAASNFVTLLGYNGRLHPTAQDSPNGYWNFWLSGNGSDWTSSQFGVQGIVFSDTLAYKPDFSNNPALYAAPWHGARWVSNYLTETAQAPRTPLAAAVAAPEPGTIALLLPIGLMFVARRRRL